MKSLCQLASTFHFHQERTAAGEGGSEKDQDEDTDLGVYLSSYQDLLNDRKLIHPGLCRKRRRPELISSYNWEYMVSDKAKSMEFKSCLEDSTPLFMS